MPSPRDVPTLAGDVLRGSVSRAGALLAGGVQGATATIQLGERVAANLERALELHIRTLEVAQPLVAALTHAVEDGLLDDLRLALRAVDAGTGLVEQMTQQLATMNTLLDGTTQVVRDAAATATGVIENLPATRVELAQLREAMDRMVGQMAAVAPLGTLPGVSRALGFIPPPFGRQPARPSPEDAERGDAGPGGSGDEG
jgi:hypothetical protein